MENKGQVQPFYDFISVSALRMTSLRSIPTADATIINVRNVGLFCFLTRRVIAVRLIPVSLDMRNLVILRLIRSCSRISTTLWDNFSASSLFMPLHYLLTI